MNPSEHQKFDQETFEQIVALMKRRNYSPEQGMRLMIATAAEIVRINVELPAVDCFNYIIEETRRMEAAVRAGGTLPPGKSPEKN